MPTFRVKYKEWVCVEEGLYFEFLQPRGRMATSELHARYEFLYGQWHGRIAESEAFAEEKPDSGKFVVISQEEYDALEVKDPDTAYFVSESTTVHIGMDLMSSIPWRIADGVITNDKMIRLDSGA